MTRQPTDRRRRPTRVWDVIFTPGRRRMHRRAEDANGKSVALVDRYHGRLRLPIYAALVLTLLDGILTLQIIHRPNDEANPLMALALERGVAHFLLAKVGLTALGVGVLLVLGNTRLVRGKVKVIYLIPLTVVLYSVLLCAQLAYLYRFGGEALDSVPGQAVQSPPSRVDRS